MKINLEVKYIKASKSYFISVSTKDFIQAFPIKEREGIKIDFKKEIKI